MIVEVLREYLGQERAPYHHKQHHPSHKFNLNNIIQVLFIRQYQDAREHPLASESNHYFAPLQASDQFMAFYYMIISLYIICHAQVNQDN